MAIKGSVVNYLRDFGILVVLVLLIAFFMVISPEGFAQPGNLINVVRQAAINGIIATGMMFVIISGGIDLSSGSTVALAGVVSATMAISGLPLIVAIAGGLLAGAAVGFVNGFGVAYLGLPAFIITLATMTGVRGLALILSGGAPVFGLPPEFANIASSVLFSGVPILVLYFVLVIVGAGFVLNRTIFGRRVYTIGGNEEAAIVSGIRTKRYLLGVYTLAGALAGFAGILVASRTMQGSPTAGVGYELDAIAAVVIGGVSMSGGSGKWYGTLIGALLIAVMSSGLDILGVDSNYQAIIKGAIIAIAVYFDQRSKNLISK